MDSAQYGRDTNTAPNPDRLRRTFLGGFSVMDIAEPLASFDPDRDSQEVRIYLEKHEFDVVGVREEGHVRAYVSLDNLLDGAIATSAKPILPAEVLPESATLQDLVRSLCAVDRVFVSVLGSISAIATRTDLQKPAMRMWLFGMVTLIEFNVMRGIRALFPGDSWKAHVPAKRLAKAEELHAERARRNQQSTLLDCLQLSDKAGIMLRIPEYRSKLGYASRREADRDVKSLESLRNNLAHAQDIILHDWHAIVQLVESLDDMFESKRIEILLTENKSPKS